VSVDVRVFSGSSVIFQINCFLFSRELRETKSESVVRLRSCRRQRAYFQNWRYRHYTRWQVGAATARSLRWALILHFCIRNSLSDWRTSHIMFVEQRQQTLVKRWAAETKNVEKHLHPLQILWWRFRFSSSPCIIEKCTGRQFFPASYVHLIGSRWTHVTFWFLACLSTSRFIKRLAHATHDQVLIGRRRRHNNRLILARVSRPAFFCFRRSRLTGRAKPRGASLARSPVGYHIL